jgi:hypothetical protein
MAYTCTNVLIPYRKKDLDSINFINILKIKYFIKVIIHPQLDREHEVFVQYPNFFFCVFNPNR